MSGSIYGSIIAAWVLTMAGCKGCGQQPAYSSLRLMTPTDWYLEIDSRGSGSYGFGNADFIPLPPGTFDFNQTVLKLSASLESKGSIATDYAVSFREPSQTGLIKAKYTRDNATVAALFAKARAVASGERIEELWQKSPPTPDPTK